MSAQETMVGAESVENFGVRTARPDEWERVAEVTCLGFGHGRPGGRQASPERLALLRDAAGRARAGDLLVAIDPGSAEIVGTASLIRAESEYSRQSRDGEAELRLLAVLPSARRRGAGRALMIEAIRRAREWGAPAVILDTGPGNTASQALYDSLGFERIRERETRAAISGGLLAVFRYDLTPDSTT